MCGILFVHHLVDLVFSPLAYIYNQVIDVGLIGKIEFEVVIAKGNGKGIQ